MPYEPMLLTPLGNAKRACWDLTDSLYYLAKIYSNKGNLEKTERMIHLRDSFRALENELKAIEDANTDALLNELMDSGII
jgi:hypothetical protein